ncbi:MAG: DUF5403 family protein [Stackebrandtia sp.]
MSRVKLNRRLNSTAAHRPEVKAKLKSVAATVLAAAKSSAPRRSGAYAASLKVQKGKLDYHVVAEADHAAAVEFGHTSQSGEWVDGHHVLGKAADSVQ